MAGSYMRWRAADFKKLRRWLDQGLTKHQIAMRFTERKDDLVTLNQITGLVRRLKEKESVDYIGPRPPEKWRAETIEALTQLHFHEGHSIRACAAIMTERFCDQYTRGAISGQVHRLRKADPTLPAVEKDRVRRTAAKPRRGKRRRAFARSAWDGAPASAKRKPASHKLPVLPGEPEPLRLTILEIANGKCRWPVGGKGAGTEFCGHDTGGISASWCPIHHRRAFMPAKDSAAPPRVADAGAATCADTPRTQCGRTILPETAPTPIGVGAFFGMG